MASPISLRHQDRERPANELDGPFIAELLCGHVITPHNHPILIRHDNPDEGGLHDGFQLGDLLGERAVQLHQSGQGSLHGIAILPQMRDFPFPP